MNKDKIWINIFEFNEKKTPETFVHFLKQNNYHTVGIGKISHYPEGRVYDSNEYRITQYFRNENPVIELYDLKSDPYESVNIAKENPNLVQELISKIAAAPNPYR